MFRFIVDSGASAHMSDQRRFFKNLRPREMGITLSEVSVATNWTSKPSETLKWSTHSGLFLHSETASLYQDWRPISSQFLLQLRKEFTLYSLTTLSSSSEMTPGKWKFLVNKHNSTISMLPSQFNTKLFMHLSVVLLPFKSGTNASAIWAARQSRKWWETILLRT